MPKIRLQNIIESDPEAISNYKENMLGLMNHPEKQLLLQALLKLVGSEPYLSFGWETAEKPM